MPKRHGLGVGNGKIIEYDDGTAGYIRPGAFTQVFRVNVADVTGFSVTKGGKVLERQINVLGNGTLLGSASVPHGTAEKIEQWFRAHPRFGKQLAIQAEVPELTSIEPSGLVADELRKLADLRSEGVLTDDEFAAAKERLLGG